MRRPRTPHHLRNRRGGLIGQPDRDRVAVVRDDIQHRQVQTTGGVERLPELALGGGAVAQRHICEFVAVGDTARKLGTAADITRRFCASDRRQTLAGGARRLTDDVESARTPMARHLTASRRGVVNGADGLEQHLLGRDTQRKDEGTVPVVRKEPVVAGPQMTGEAEQQRLVTGAGYLEERTILLAQRDLAIIEAARHER